jgi:hypothetical protein
MTNFINSGGDLNDVPKELMTKELCELTVKQQRRQNGKHKKIND